MYGRFGYKSLNNKMIIRRTTTPSGFYAKENRTIPHTKYMAIVPNVTLDRDNRCGRYRSQSCTCTKAMQNACHEALLLSRVAPRTRPTSVQEVDTTTPTRYILKHAVMTHTTRVRRRERGRVEAMLPGEKRDDRQHVNRRSHESISIWIIPVRKRRLEEVVSQSPCQ